MMHTDQNFNRPTRTPPQPSIAAGPAPTLASTPVAELTRTRCPGCQKLFAVETDTLSAMTRAGVIRAEFTCTGEMCREEFAIELPLPANYSSLTIVPAMHLDRQAALTPSKAPSAQDSYEIPSQEDVEKYNPAPKAAIQAPLRSKASTMVAERECPRCGAANQAAMNECVRCGIVFDRYAEVNDAQLEEEIALGGTRELSQLWDKALEDYEDRIRHDRFLNACRDANALSYASKKYSSILIAAPQDDIARLMRNRIVAMISMRAESSRLPIRLSFRIPKINSIALFGGSILFFWGLMMPQLKNIMEIGLSLVLLSIGVRLALRARL